MKTALAVFGGLVLSLALFLSGAVIAVLFLTGNPEREPRLDVNQSEVWTRHPRPVDKAAQQFERLPARSAAPPVNASGESKTSITVDETEEERSPELLDTVTTTSIEPAPAKETPTSSDMPAAHAEWCAKRYRTYRPQDNTYRPYSGGRQTCISPYMDAAGGSSENTSPPGPGSYAEGADDAPMPMEYSAEAEEGIYLTQEHVAYCFSRYRSYRPEDNSYQPYSGGPRRQCR
ncbi:BA14K family protein [Sinorhizobium arboris]|uniref:BA14K family protein n=1 Tax=Sinorhizobium arboris TaxID=76745 RepID=UPI00041BC000|nr:BA14K family protein [Sinorhizobium arboris]